MCGPPVSSPRVSEILSENAPRRPVRPSERVGRSQDRNIGQDPEIAVQAILAARFPVSGASAPLLWSTALDHHPRPRQVAAGRGQGAPRPLPIAGARFHQPAQLLDRIPALADLVLRPGPVARQADREIRTAIRAGPPATTTPDPAACDARSQVLVAPVLPLARPAGEGTHRRRAGGLRPRSISGRFGLRGARPLPRTPSPVYASLRGYSHFRLSPPRRGPPERIICVGCFTTHPTGEDEPSSRSTGRRPRPRPPCGCSRRPRDGPGCGDPGPPRPPGAPLRTARRRAGP